MGIRKGGTLFVWRHEIYYVTGMCLIWDKLLLILILDIDLMKYPVARESQYKKNNYVCLDSLYCFILIIIDLVIDV